MLKKKALHGPPPDVLLAVMPFGPIFQPSLGATILREALAEYDLQSRIEYFSIQFVDIIGLATYERISEYYPDSRKLFGEWIFSHTLFPGNLNREKVSEYLELSRYNPGTNFDAVAGLCDIVGSSQAEIEAYIDSTAERIISLRSKLVGFTSMFQQHTASLAVAKRIKAASPETFIVFGGANVEGPMGIETLRSFPWVDAVVSGPGEIALPLIAKSISEGEPPPAIPGVTYQTCLVDAGRAMIAPELPLDHGRAIYFDDFFEAYASSQVLRDSGTTPSVLVETSRGCWWGQKHHCTFCGLNGAQMNFRMKSAERAVSDLKHLAKTYPESRVVVTDNIMPQSYYRDVLPALKKTEFPSGLFFEVKANATEEQIERLANAGVDMVQVGIENFSPSLLRHMRKGVSCIANIAFLKHCATHNIKPNWILLTGFPCETEADYLWNINIIRLIRHLDPPQISTEIRIDRFSPNHTSFREFGFSSIKPVPAYSAIYRDDSVRLEDLAYFFEGEAAAPKGLKATRAELDKAVSDWKSTFPCSEFWAIDAGEEDIIVDARSGAQHLEVYHLDRATTSLLRACESKTPLEAISKADSVQEPRRRIADLEELGILFCESNAAISLPLRLGRSRHRISAPTYDALVSSGVVSAKRDARKDLQLSFGKEIKLGIRQLDRRTM
jgi:ribosomal peptide maturation radical SAM protein 1